MNCSACGAEIAPASAACPSCGASLDLSRTRTLDSPGPGVLDESSDTPSSAFDDGRFVPGTLLAGRYRIVGMLGRGGMGEVYRAEDLKLGETVALKLLPAELSQDGAALARFHKEVKVARRITDRNICRMYDIGESEGLHFLSMEYIDGEDLGSLLRRIGRLPADKALEISRQLCAGLAAAHAEGVLHRDLKPANVMVDGRGRAKIMDFGLAGLVKELEEGELAGTPAYMAPEQLGSGTVSFRSDVYSMGLVLYETFTGRRPFEAATRVELMALHRSGPPSQPSTIVEALDPLVERVLMSCLEADPRDRPASALAVSAGLPGGDPLAAALRAGETPSPEMVAAAPDRGGLRPMVALACFVGILVMLAAWVPLAAPQRLENLAGLTKSPEVLRERASSLAQRWRSPPPEERSSYSKVGWSVRYSYMNHLRQSSPDANHWQVLRQGRSAGMTFWYRESQRPLHSWHWRFSVNRPDDPPLTHQGILVELDPQGRLLRWNSLPPEPGGSGSGPSHQDQVPNWGEFFAEAGLDRASFQPTESSWVQPLPSDRRYAWKGAYPGQPELPIRVEAGSLAEQPTYFVVVEPWDDSVHNRLLEQQGASTPGTLMVLLLALLLTVGLWLAYRNLASGRSDRRGAARLATFVFCSLVASYVVGGYHSLSAEAFEALRTGLGGMLFYVALLYVSYLAAEPFLRRLLPHSMVSWSRLLVGQIRDPLVARDVLVGVVSGVTLQFTSVLALIALARFGSGYPVWDDLWHINLLAPRQFLGALAGLHVLIPIFNALAMTVIFVLIYAGVRNKRWAAVIFMVVVAVLYPLSWHHVVPFALLLTVAVVRFGLVTTNVHILVFLLLNQTPITTDLDLWFADRMMLVLALVVGLAAYGWRFSRTDVARPGLSERPT